MIKYIFLFFFFFFQTAAYCCTGSIGFTTNSPICAGGQISFTNTTSNADTCIWKWGDATANTIVNSTSNQTHTYATAGTYTVWLVRRITSPSCRDSVSHQVIVNALPSASFTMPNNNACSLTPITFTNTSTGTGLTYAWDFGDGATSTSISPSHQYNAYGAGGTQNFSVTLVATSVNGCSATVTHTATVVKRPDAAMYDNTGSTTPFANCNSASAYSLAVQNGTLFTSLVTSYDINWGDGSTHFNSSNFADTSHNYAIQGYSNVVLTVTSSNGCGDTAVYQFYNGSNPAIALGNPGSTNGCLPSTYVFPISSVSTNAPGTTYQVTFNDGTANINYNQINLPSSISHLFSLPSCGYTAGTYNNAFLVSISASNPCGSSSATVAPITISEKPDANFITSPTPNACVNQTVTFTNTSTNANQVVSSAGNYICSSTTKINWSITPSSGWTVVNGQIGNANPNINNPTSWGSNVLGVQFSVAGTYTIKLFAGGVSCGNDTATQVICITNPVTPTFTVSANTGCSPLNVTTVNNTSSPTCGTNTYNWSVTYSASSPCDNASQFNFTNSTTASSINPSFQFVNAGTYTITLSVTNVCGTQTTSQTVVVKKKPLVTLGSISGSCVTPYVITPTLTDTNCANNALTYAWTFAGGTPATSSLSAPSNISFSSTGNHLVTLNLTNECGSTSASTSFTIVPNTPVSVTPSSPSICVGGSITLNASNAVNYSWSPATGLNTTTGNSVIASPSTTTTYTVTGTSGTCTSSAQVTVTVNALPTISISPNASTICVGQNVSLTASGANTYSWTPTTNLSASNAAVVAASPTSTSNYTVTGTNTNGCSSTQNVTVTVNPLPVVSAGTTPQQFCNTNTPVTLTGFSPANGTWSGTGVTAAGVFTPSLAGVGNTTLTYSVTDGNGCVNSSSMVANVINPQFANAGTGFNICANANAVTLTGFTPSGGTWSGSGVTGTSFNPTGLSAGVTTLTYSIGSGSCLSTDTILVNVNSLPSVSITPNTATICVGQNVSLTASGANTYSWTPTTNLSASNIATVAASPTSTSTYTVTGTNTNGCTSTQNITVTLNPLPVVSAGTTPQQFCNTNTPITLTGYSPTGVGGIWSGTGVTSVGVFTPSAAGTGSTTLTYTFTDGNGCVNSSTIVANVIVPQVANAGTGFNICTNANAVTLNGFTPSGGTWSGNGVTGTSFNPVGLSAGVTTLTYSIGTGSCLSTDTILINVNSLPSVSITPNAATICVGQNVSLTASGANTYSWTPTTNLSASNIAAVTASPASTSTYSVTGTNTNGCSSTQSVTVTVNALPTVVAGTTPQQFCNTNTPVTLTGYSPTGVGGIWSGTGVTSLGVFTPSVAGTGSTTLTYTFTDGNGCVNSSSVVANVINPQFANAGTGFNICTNANAVTLNGFTPSGGTWSGSGVTGTSFNPTGLSAGVTTLTYSIGSGSCLSTDTILIQVNALPALSITPNASTICVGQSVSLTASGASTYSWSPTTNLTASNTAAVTASPTSTSTYTVTGTNTYGCSSIQNVTVTVNPLPTISAGATPQQFCNTNIPVTLTGYNPAGGTWSGTGVTSAGVFTPAIADTGSTTLTYTVTDNNNCSNSVSIIANVITPQIANAGSGFNICTNANSVILNGYTPSGGTWSGLGVTGATFDPVGLSTGLTTLTYSIGSGTCLSTDTILIQVNPLPTVSITPNAATICVGQNVSLTASGASTYSWSPSTTLNVSNTAVVVATPVITTAYTVVGISSLGCANTDSISIHVNQLPIVEAGINQQFCNTNTLMPLTGATPLGGTWSGIGVTASDFNPSILGVDSTYLTYAYTDAVTGCSNTDSLLAIVISPTNANAGNGFSVCKNHSDTLLQGATPAGGIWSGSNITSGIFSPNSASPGISVLTYTTGSGSCQTSDTLQINVVSQPILNVTANPLTVCNGTSATLNVTGASTYVWLPTIYSAQVTGASSTVVPFDTAYFSVIGTNTYGCSTKDSIKINVNQLPIVNAGSDEQYCNQNIPIQLTGFTPANGVWSGLGVSSSGQFNPSITGLGIHDLIYTFTDANGCVNSDTMKASVAIPIQANAGLDTAICQTLSTFSFQGSPTNGIWSGLHITSAGVFTPDSAGTYILTYTFGTGTCKTTDTKTVIVHPLPLVNIGPDISTCITSPSQLLFSNVGGGIWAGNGIVNTSTGLFTAYNAGVGITDVTYQITSSTTGCVNTDTVKINVHDLPIPQFDSVVVSCLNVPIQFVNNTVGSNTYVWYFGDGSTSTMMNPQHTYADTGIFHVKLVVTSQFGCVDSTDKLLIVTIPPVSNFSQSNSMSCGPLVSNFINSSIAQYATYQWSFGNGNISSLMSPSSETFQLGSLGDTTYFNTLTVTNNCGVSTHVDSIIVLHEPINSLGLNVNSGCSPLSIQFTNTTTGSNNTYNYDFGNGITSSSSALSFQQVFTSLTSDTTYYIQLIATNICGVDSLFDSVTVHPNTVNAAFNTFPLSGCSPLHVAFTNYSTTNCNYYWNFGNGNVSSAVNTSQTFTTVDTASSYTIKLIITNGCSYDTAVTSIQVNAQPNLAFTVSKDSICAGNSVSIINQSQNLSTTSWNFGDGLSSSLFSPTHTFLNGGNFNVTLIGTSALTNCSDTLSDLVTVIPKPIISLSPIQSVGCEPYEFSIVNNSQFSDFYSWNFGDGNTGVGQTPQHTYDTTGLFQGQLIASNFFNCIDSTIFYILVNPKPISSFNLEHISRCTIPDTIKLLNNSIGAIGSNWSFGDGAVSTLNNPTHIYSLHGDYPISLIAISDKNCSDTLTIDYKVKEAPIADFNPTSADNCKPIIKFENLSQFAMDYLWLFSDGAFSDEAEPIHDYKENYDSSFVYLITDPGSLCSDTIKKLVHHSNGSHPYVWIPNAFTPNSDGLNDKLELVGFDECDEYNFRIFDRWGNVVFETSDLSVSWDGSKFQKDAEVEVYNYIFQNYTRRIKKYGKIVLSR